MDVHTPLPYLTAQWIPALRTFLATMDGQIKLDRHYIPALQRHGDEHIMDKVVDSGAFSTTQMQQINWCRLYLDVSTVSNLTTANGKFIDTAISQGHRTSLSGFSCWHKTNQAQPSSESWMQWNHVCRIWSHCDGSLFSPFTLWLVPGLQLRRSWPCYFDYQDQHFLQLALYDDSFIEGIEVEWSPNNHCYLVEATPCAHIWYVTQPILPIIDSVSPFIPATFPELINTLEPWEQEMLQHLTFHVPPFQLIQELLDWAKTSEAKDTSTNIWQMLFVSDGSELHKKMSSGWVLSTPTGTWLAPCYGPATGPNSSHHAKSYAPTTPPLPNLQYLLPTSCHAPGKDMSFPLLI
jgi:hypothetical protein